MTDKTWTEIADEWMDTSVCPEPTPAGNALVGGIVQEAVRGRWKAYLAGVRGAGKTCLMLTMARLAALHWALPVTYISTESPTDELRTALLAGEAGVAAYKVSRFDLGAGEREKVRTAGEKLAAARLHIHGQARMSVSGVRGLIERHHPLDEPGLILVDGLRNILSAEQGRDSSFTVEDLMTQIHVYSQGGFVASGWLETHWSAMADRTNPTPRWTDVPEPVEWTFPHLISLGKQPKGSVSPIFAQFNGGGLDIYGSLKVQGFFLRVIDA